MFVIVIAGGSDAVVAGEVTTTSSVTDWPFLSAPTAHRPFVRIRSSSRWTPCADERRARRQGVRQADMGQRGAPAGVIGNRVVGDVGAVAVERREGDWIGRVGDR